MGRGEIQLLSLMNLRGFLLQSIYFTLVKPRLKVYIYEPSNDLPLMITSLAARDPNYRKFSSLVNKGARTSQQPRWNFNGHPKGSSA